MIAVITGASGLLGGNLAIELLKQGHRVRATRRGGSQVAHLAEHAIEWVPADLSDPAALTAAFRGADVAFHCAAQVSIRRQVTPEMTAANVDGTRHVIQAVRAAGVPRLVHCSTVAAIGLSEDGRPCDETARFNFAEHRMEDAYVTTKHQAEQVVQQAAAQGLDAVIANPTYMLGPCDARPSSGRLILAVARREVPATTSGLNNFVDVRDVARGMILCWHKGRRGERYILGQQTRSYQDIMLLIAREAGVAPPRFRAPRPLGQLLGWAGDLQQRLTGREPLVNSVTIGWSYCETFQFTSEKARRELGYAAGPIEPAIRDALAWFRQRGML